MEIATLILEILILLGIAYVIVFQETKIKTLDKMLKAFKDYPETIKGYLKLKDEKRELEAEKQIKKAVALAVLAAKETAEKFSKEAKDYVRNLIQFIAKLVVRIEDQPELDKLVEELDNEDVKKPLRGMIEELKKIT